VITWVIISVALSCLFYVMWSTRGWRGIRTLKHFLLHDGNLEPPGFWGTMVATNTAIANGFFLYLVLGYYHGWGAFFWTCLFWIVGLAVFQFFNSDLGKQFKDLVTLNEFLGDKATSRSGTVRNVVAIVTAISFLLTLSMELVVGSQIFFSLVGPNATAPKWATMVIPFLLALTIAVYLAAGGFPAVVKSDIAQVLFFIPGLLVLGWVVWPYAKTTLPTSAAQVFIPKQWPFIVFSLFSWGAWFLVAMDMWQRCAATGSTTKPRKPTWLSLCFLIPFTFVSIACGIWVHSSQSPIGYRPIPQVFMEMFVYQAGLPTWPIVLVFLALVAAILSSADTFMMVVAHSLFADVGMARNGINFKTADALIQRKYLFRIRVFLLCLPLLCALGFAFAVYIAGANVLAMNYISYSIPLSLLAPVVIALRRGQMSGTGTIAGAIAGCVAVALFCIPLALDVAKGANVDHNLRLLYACPAVAAGASAIAYLIFKERRK